MAWLITMPAGVEMINTLTPLLSYYGFFCIHSAGTIGANLGYLPLVSFHIPWSNSGIQTCVFKLTKLTICLKKGYES